MVALMCSWHGHHLRAVEAIEGRQSRGERMVIAAPALVEAYAVLTRLPPPHRLAPNVAHTLIDANFVRGVTSVALRAADYRTLLRTAPEDDVSGGRTYDAVIARCALRAGVKTLLTFNLAHFQQFASATLSIVVPD